MRTKDHDFRPNQRVRVVSKFTVWTRESQGHIALVGKEGYVVAIERFVIVKIPGATAPTPDGCWYFEPDEIEPFR